MTRTPYIALLLACLLMSGCMVGPDYHRPEVVTPPTWGEIEPPVPNRSDAVADGIPTAWWNTFDDELLVSLVRRTVQGRDHILSLNAGAMADAAEWIEYYRQFWEDRLAALEKFVISQRSSAKKGNRT